MSYRPILFTVGILLLILSAAMMLPMAIDLAADNPDWRVFAGSQCITGFFGLAMVLTSRQDSVTINLKQAFLLTNAAWVVTGLFGALPFYFSDLGLSYTDSVFEAVSGVTTTGSTIIADIEILPPGILFWRAILQWLGGVGILIMALSILPLLQVGGMQLFKTESLDMEKVLPSAAKIAAYIGVLYIILTLLCALFYNLAGMSGFDAFAHAMTTIATGGYSTYNASIAHFDSPLIDAICIVFMWLGALPFVLYLRTIRGDYTALTRDTQVRWFFGIVASISFIIITYLLLNQGWDFAEAVQKTLFNITSLITGTGFTTSDYSLWGSFVVSIAFFAMCIGGCAGSTSCGIKIFRFQVLYAVTSSQIKKMINPHGVFPAYYNHKPIPRDVPVAVMSFFFMFALIFALMAVSLQLCGLDFVTAMSGAVTAISNVGPGLGDVIGPAGNFAPLPDAAKWILCLGMLMGRLELFTFLVMLSPRFWRR